MRRLTVHKFSCIDDATLNISPITLIIGPQASGKSLLCKLSYFFASLLTEQARASTDRKTHEEFLAQTKSKFLRWFPFETWGPHKFELTFHFGKHWVEIFRTISKGKGGKSVNVRFSPEFLEHYARSLSQMQAAGRKKTEGEDLELDMVYWELQRSVREDLAKTLGDDFVNSQLYIPAARSFFTSLGKAIPVFENSNMLDPVTVIFGKAYTSGSLRYPIQTPQDRTIHSLLKEATVSMLGGSLVRDGDRETVHTKDGRKIPLSALSSGQQEIFPLLKVLPNAAPKGVRRLVYVEEPEAHLFPDAQSKLVELLAALVNLYGPTTAMLVTTHSPYILTKFNNLITAGKIAKLKNHATAVAAIVSNQSWVSAGQIGAYALNRGHLKSIVDKDGLIDAEYLDDVSNQIGNEYTRLLDVEYGRAKGRASEKE